jgi:DNA-binding NarL/FixJ family response regulator
MKTLSVTISNEHRILSDSLIAALDTFVDVKIIGAYKGNDDTIVGLCNDLPDIALIELNKVNKHAKNADWGDGFSILHYIKDSKLATKVIVLSDSKDLATVQMAIELGALSFLLKSVSINVLKIAIDTVHAGNTFFPREIKQELDRAREQITKTLPFKLTNREEQVLSLVSRGYSTPLIAQELALHKETISDYRESLMKKLRAKNAADLVRISYEWGIL